MIDRKRLPVDRESVIHRFVVGGQKGYVIVSVYNHDESCGRECVLDCRMGKPGEIFIHMAPPSGLSDGVDQAWSTLRGFADAVAVSTSLLLQMGVPFTEIAEKHVGTKFAPSGLTKNQSIPTATSVLDYVFRYIWKKVEPVSYKERFGPPYENIVNGAL